MSGFVQQSSRRRELVPMNSSGCRSVLTGPVLVMAVPECQGDWASVRAVATSGRPADSQLLVLTVGHRHSEHAALASSNTSMRTPGWAE